MTSPFLNIFMQRSTSDFSKNLITPSLLELMLTDETSNPFSLKNLTRISFEVNGERPGKKTECSSYFGFGSIIIAFWMGFSYCLIESTIWVLKSSLVILLFLISSVSNLNMQWGQVVSEMSQIHLHFGHSDFMFYLAYFYCFSYSSLVISHI